MSEFTPKTWAHALTPEMRDELKRLHQINPWISIGKILAFLGLWLGLANLALRAEHWWYALPCYAVMGLLYHGFGVFAHEGAHEVLFGWGWVDRVVGFFCGLPIAFPCNNYRATHLLHHRYENTEKDPDNLDANIPNPILRQMFYWLWYPLGMNLYIPHLMMTGPFRAKGWKEKLICLAETGAIIGFFWALFTAAQRYDFMDTLIYGWILGIPFASLTANIRGLAEHTQLHRDDPPNPLKCTRTTVSNAFTSFFLNNQNYHLEHHLFPRVPWYNLPRVHKLLQPIYRSEDAAIIDGYATFLRDAWRYGPLQTLSYHDGQTTLDP